MLNKWRDLISQHENVGRYCDHTLREATKKMLQERKMRIGFQPGQSNVMVEKSKPGESVDRRDDSKMRTMGADKAVNHQSEKLRDFAERRKQVLADKIMHHNLNLAIGEDEMKEFADDDLGADVVDKRVEKQKTRRREIP